MNALLDYGSSSSAESGEETDTECDEKSTTQDEKLTLPHQLNKLPKPTLENNLTTSVFSNPFVREEMAKAAILEKHVKMVPGKHHVQVINGKKICFAHRKGKCRFGHKCKYAHDSDIQKTPEEIHAEKQKLNTVICEKPGTMPLLPTPQFNANGLSNDNEIEEKAIKKRKRPGLSQGLVPGQKVLKLYQEQKLKEAFNNRKQL